MIDGTRTRSCARHFDRPADTSDVTPDHVDERRNPAVDALAQSLLGASRSSSGEPILNHAARRIFWLPRSCAQRGRVRADSRPTASRWSGSGSTRGQLARVVEIGDARHGDVVNQPAATA